MSIFEELCHSMQEAEKRQHDFFTTARNMSFDFADCLRNYMESPEKWMNLEEIGKPNPDTKQYIYPVSVDKHGNEVDNDGHPFANMYVTSDKFYLFKIAVTLEKGTKIYPKAVYKLACGVRPQANNKCRLFVAYTFGDDPHKKELQCDNSTGFVEPSKYAVELLQRFLNKEIYIFD